MLRPQIFHSPAHIWGGGVDREPRLLPPIGQETVGKGEERKRRADQITQRARHSQKLCWKCLSTPKLYI